MGTPFLVSTGKWLAGSPMTPPARDTIGRRADAASGCERAWSGALGASANPEPAQQQIRVETDRPLLHAIVQELRHGDRRIIDRDARHSNARPVRLILDLSQRVVVVAIAKRGPGPFPVAGVDLGAIVPGAKLRGHEGAVVVQDHGGTGLEPSVPEQHRHGQSFADLEVAPQGAALVLVDEMRLGADVLEADADTDDDRSQRLPIQASEVEPNRAGLPRREGGR